MRHTDIQGWCDYEALLFEQVRRSKDGARFVEVGCWKGRSTAYLAEQIKRLGKKIDFYAVDTWVGSSSGPDNDECCVEMTPADLFEQFNANLKACGVEDVVHVLRRESVLAAEHFDDGSLDFVFIDADHSEAAVYADLKAWWPKIRPGGLLAGHDLWQTGVKRAVERFVSEVKRAVYGDGSNSNFGYRCYGIPKPQSESAKIMLALPGYDGSSNVAGLVVAATCPYSGPGEVILKPNYTSLLAANFNMLWCVALNDPSLTHFAMLHGDIIPMRWWLDVLLHEMDAENAQMVSVVVPIKGDEGVTSTGIYDPTSKWVPKRRFTMHEIMAMPATFGPEQTAYPDHKLVLNTGCWIADLRDPRWQTQNASGELYCHFEINDRIVRNADGSWIPQVQPEDFNFSVMAQELGMKVCATRKVQLKHVGSITFPNDCPWGTQQVDETTRKNWDRPQTEAAA